MTMTNPPPQLTLVEAHLSLRLKRIGETADVVLERALVAQELDIGAVDLDAAFLALDEILLTAEGSEAPVLGHDDFLAARELVLRAAEGFDGSRTVAIPCSDAQNDLTNVDTGDGAVGLAESTTHTSLESIGSGARQHLVDTDDVVRVGAHAEMEPFLSCDLDKVLVGADTGSFQCFRAQLLIFVGDKVDAEREFVDVRTLTTKVEDPNLGVGHTTVEPRLGIRLVLAVAVASRWTTSHFDGVSGVVVVMAMGVFFFAFSD